MRLIAAFQQYLFRWRSDGASPLRLGQRRIFILPTRAGLLFAVALIVMLIGAINYTLALGHALVFLLSSLAVVGMIHTFRNLHGLMLTPGRSEPVFAGETALFGITLGNDRVEPRIGLEFQVNEGTFVSATVDRKNSQNIQIPVLAQHRGWLEFPRIRLSTRYPLGLFQAWAYYQPSMRCLIYPQPIASPLPAQAFVARTGEGVAIGGNEDFAGFRERQAADALRHVAWKASARGDGPLLVKQFADGSAREYRFDWELTEPNLSTEARLGILTGWVLFAASERIPYALRCPGIDIGLGSDDAHRLQCLEALALFSA